MADDKTFYSTRADSPTQHSPAPASERGGGGDPLAELARLIGQSDPFTQDGGPPREQTAAPPQAARDWRSSPPPFALRATDAPLAPQHEPAGQYAAPAYDDVEQRAFARTAPFASSRHAPHQDRAQYPAADDAADQGVPYYSDDVAAAPNEEDAYDDPPQVGRRRSGIVMALTLVGCATLGTAGAYGYRTYYTGPAATTAAPVIVADKTPTKVVPASDAQSSKAIQDRVSDQGQAERMVPREEQPVELKPPPEPVPPRVVATLPAAPSFESPPVVRPSVVPTPPAAATPAASGEPKRVRTLTIRADGSDPSGRPVGVASSSQTPRAAPKAARSAPLSLDPQQLTEASATPGPAGRAAPLTPPAPRVASAPAAGGTGGYVVQVSSQRTEAEAQASYRAMQAKYPSAFNGRSPIIRRADLGAKGVFYRALVGPFASSGDAGHFCSSLKAAGGQCIVQKN